VDERDGKGLGDGSSAVVKLTGFAFGPDADVDGAAKHTLFIANGNDYSSVVGGKSNPNQFFCGRRSTAMRATTTVTDAVAAPRGSECG